MTEPTVGAGYAKAVLDFAASKGASRKALSERSGISPDDLVDRDKRIPFGKLVALMRAAKALCDDPAFGLHYGEASLFSDISIVGLICDAAETMAEAFVQLNRYARLVIDDGEDSGERFGFDRRTDGLWIEFRGKDPNDYPEITESTFARFAAACMRYSPDGPPFIKLCRVSHAKPAYAAEYERVLRAPVEFECAQNEILIEESWLSVRGPNYNRYVFGIFSDRAEALLRSLENSTTIRGQVESALIPVLHKGEPAMAAIARKLGMSRATLYRKLKAEGVGFDQLLDELRLKMALHYLGGEKASVYETAYLVGYSDPTAFSRAFKRWTGASPRAARAAGGAESPGPA